MKTTQESTGELTAVVKIEIGPEDYQGKINKSLKDLQHKANIPGFRPGRVPFGMITKMYGDNVKLEEINKTLSEALDNHIKSNNLEIIGLPLLNHEKTDQGRNEIEDQDNFVFFFDLGLVPKFELNIDKNISVDYFDVIVSDKEVNDYLVGMQRRFGNLVDVDLSELSDSLKGNFMELDETSVEKPDGIKSENTILIDVIKDETIRNLFIGKKPGDKVIFNPSKAFEKASGVAVFLNIKKEEAENLTSDFEFVIEKIIRLVPAELGKELYEKIFPSRNIETEEQVRELLKTGLKQSIDNDNESSFINDAVTSVVEAHHIAIPDDFLKRWLLENGEDKITSEQLDVQYPSYANGYRWQMIQNKIVKKYNLEVTDDDVRAHIKSWFVKDSTQPQNPEQEESLNKIVDSMLYSEEQVKNIHDQLFNERLKAYFMENLTVNHQEVSYEDFIKKSYDHHH